MKKIYSNSQIERLLNHFENSSHRPENNGQVYALNGYLRSKLDGESDYIVRDIGFVEDIPDFIAFLDMFEIREFILADNSTALMEILCYFLSAGWYVTDRYSKQEAHSTLFGLRLRKGI